LRAFVATAQQDDDRVATPLEINPIAGAVVDSIMSRSNVVYRLLKGKTSLVARFFLS
jgi:hypothetical protein